MAVQPIGPIQSNFSGKGICSMRLARHEHKQFTMCCIKIRLPTCHAEHTATEYSFTVPSTWTNGDSAGNRRIQNTNTMAGPSC